MEIEEILVPPKPSSARGHNNNPCVWVRDRTVELYGVLDAGEISGSLGDLGTLIPLLVAMARQRSVSFAPALFFAGVSNVVSGYAWDVPMCVQPMKSIAAVALAEGLSKEEVAAAGITVGAVMVLVGVTGLIEAVNVVVPGTVVAGIQVGVGVRLFGKGVAMITERGWLGRGTNNEDGHHVDSGLLAVVTAVLVLYWLHRNNVVEADHHHNINNNNNNNNNNNITAPLDTEAEETNATSSSSDTKRPRKFQHPVGVYLFLIGAVFAAYTLATTDNDNDQYDLPLRLFGAPVAVWVVDSITAEDWKVGFLEGAIPQLPLTTLNSVISVCALANSLYPDKKLTASPTSFRREVSVSVGLMNLLLCPFGSMPNCHGAGGLAAQHRLGARHGASVVFLGACKVLLAVFFGKSALTLLDAVPASVLGVMLALSGVELASTGFTFLVGSASKDVEPGEGDRNGAAAKKERLRRHTVVALITACVIISVGKTHYGALSGWVAHMVYDDGVSQLWKRWRRTRQPMKRPDRENEEGGPGLSED